MKNPMEHLKNEERLFNYQGADKIITSLELKEKLDAMPPSAYFFKTRVPSLDKILDGVEAGELIVVSGPTGNGKTTLLTSITLATAFEVPSVWFSMEMTQKQFIAKFGASTPMFYLPSENIENNMQWLIERIIEAKVKYDVKMVFIDHLHFLFSLDKYNGKNLSLELGDIVAKIKSIAVQYNLVIWLVAHSTDDKGTNREPRMTDIRDSGMIIRLADAVMGVWRIPNHFMGTENYIGDLNETDTHTKVRVWKNRRTGKVGTFFMDKVGESLVELDKKFMRLFPTKMKYDKLFNHFQALMILNHLHLELYCQQKW